MEIQVKLYGSLGRFSQPGTPGVWRGDIPAGSTIRDLIRRIGIPEKEIWLAAIHGHACALETEIPEGAKIPFGCVIN